MNEAIGYLRGGNSRSTLEMFRMVESAMPGIWWMGVVFWTGEWASLVTLIKWEGYVIPLWHIRIKDPVLSLLWFGLLLWHSFDPWPGNFLHAMGQGQKKKKRKDHIGGPWWLTSSKNNEHLLFLSYKPLEEKVLLHKIYGHIWDM